MDLTPRTPSTTTPGRPAGRGSRRTPLAAIVLVLLLAAAGFVVVKGLTDATLYYYNADEAVARRESIGDDRIRLQGTVQDGVTVEGERVSFDVAFNGVSVPVLHRGDPPDLFEPGIPVVLEGRFEGGTFQSDRMLIKHSAEYREDNPDRVPSEVP